MSFKLLTDYLENAIDNLTENISTGLKISSESPKPIKPYNGTVYFGDSIYSYWSNDRLLGSHIFKTADRIQGISALNADFCEYFEYEFDPMLKVFDLCRIFAVEIIRKTQEIEEIMTIDELTGAIAFPPFETADLQNRKLFNVKIHCVGEADERMGPKQKLENIKYIENKRDRPPPSSLCNLYSAYNVVKVGDYFWRPHEVDEAIAIAESKHADAILGFYV